MQLVPFQQSEPAGYHLADWDRRPQPEKMAFLRDVAERSAQDTRLRRIAVDIISADGFTARAYEHHAEALLRWVQNHVRYVNETGEIIQDPLLTIELGYGDCDDQVVLLAALLGAVGLPWRFVLAGKGGWSGTRDYRWVEGNRVPRGVDWKHVYLCASWPPANPVVHKWADPSVQTAPLGWDVFTKAPVATGSSASTPAAGALLPELAGPPARSEEPTWQGTARDVGLGVVVGVLSIMLSSIAMDLLKRWRGGRAGH